ncbi:MAG TPA: TonB C-terminal domain-containing protein [Candidatus Acidoferrales bacterium]|nr:TonB C-terminal domain-containing protein [Candidatus Acidoferrales bacterium]
MKLKGLPAAQVMLCSTLLCAHASAQQERPGVPQGAAEPSVSLTRHGTIVFEADVRAPGSSRVILTETIEVSGVKNKEGWGEFISGFADSTSRAWLDAIPSSADSKKGKIIVGFALRRDGALDGALSVSHSSGDPSIDAATRLAIAKSAPFHALPASFLQSVAQLRVTFAYNHPHALPASGNGGPQ